MVQGRTDLSGSVRVVSSATGDCSSSAATLHIAGGGQAHMPAAVVCNCVDAHTGPHGAFNQASAAHPFPLHRWV